MGLEKKLLIVEDEPQLIDLYKIKFSKHNIVYATNGEEALEILDNDKKIAEVITDINMPKMNGFELLETIRKSDKSYQNIKVRAYSARESNRSRWNKIETSDKKYFYSKPEDRKKIRKHIEKYKLD